MGQGTPGGFPAPACGVLPDKSRARPPPLRSPGRRPQGTTLPTLTTVPWRTPATGELIDRLEPTTILLHLLIHPGKETTRMGTVDLAHSAHQVAYEPASPTERLLAHASPTQASPTYPARVGPVSFTWSTLDPDAARYLWPDA